MTHSGPSSVWRQFRFSGTMLSNAISLTIVLHLSFLSVVTDTYFALQKQKQRAHLFDSLKKKDRIIFFSFPPPHKVRDSYARVLEMILSLITTTPLPLRVKGFASSCGDLKWWDWQVVEGSLLVRQTAATRHSRLRQVFTGPLKTGCDRWSGSV